MRDRITIALLGLFAAAALAGPVALVTSADRGRAAFGDTETVGVNRLSSATVDVELGDRTIEIVGENMAPGDRATGSIEIDNVGTLPVRVALLADSSGDPLADWLTWFVWAPGPARSCGSETPAAATSTFVLGPTVVLGDPTPGLDPGDRIIDPGDDDLICVAAELAIDAPDTVQDRRLVQTFTIAAEQHTEELDR